MPSKTLFPKPKDGTANIVVIAAYYMQLFCVVFFVVAVQWEDVQLEDAPSSFKSEMWHLPTEKTKDV